MKKMSDEIPPRRNLLLTFQIHLQTRLVTNTDYSSANYIIHSTSPEAHSWNWNHLMSCFTTISPCSFLQRFCCLNIIRLSFLTGLIWLKYVFRSGMELGCVNHTLNHSVNYETRPFSRPRAPALVWAGSEDFNLYPGALDWQISFL